MKQYLVTAYDYTDAEAFHRRMAARPHHVDGAKALKASGNFVSRRGYAKRRGQNDRLNHDSTV
jgi:uncharacterized protein YciI